VGPVQFAQALLDRLVIPESQTRFQATYGCLWISFFQFVFSQGFEKTDIWFDGLIAPSRQFEKRYWCEYESEGYA
jgi:hypothetical protein